MIRDRLDAFVELLSTPNPKSPLNEKAAELCLQENQRQYCRTANRRLRGLKD
jgi:ubiquitin-protein ligase